MKINKETLKEFRSEFQSLALALDEKYGVKITIGNIRFSETDFKTTMTVKNTEHLDGVSPEKYEFEKDAEMYGFEKSDYKREIEYLGSMFTFIGFYPNARTKVCKMTDLEGKFYNAPVTFVKRNFKNK